MLEWENPSPELYRAPAPLFGFIRVDSYSANRWMISYSVPGYSSTLVEGEWASAEAAKTVAEGHVRNAIAAYVRENGT